MPPPHQVFLLSPANSAGKRAGFLLRKDARSALALGLRAPHDTIDLDGLHAIARVPVDPEERRYTGPLQRDAAQLAERLQATDTAILLGSIATAKYLDPLKAVLGPWLHFPREFIGRGDMSRGALMLRCAAEGRELTYVQDTEPPPD